VFELYGDRALSDALDAALKMTLSIPMSDILAYRKVCKQFSCPILFMYTLFVLQT
jgi:exportin-7